MSDARLDSRLARQVRLRERAARVCEAFKRTMWLVYPDRSAAEIASGIGIPEWAVRKLMSGEGALLGKAEKILSDIAAVVEPKT